MMLTHSLIHFIFWGLRAVTLGWRMYPCIFVFVYKNSPLYIRTASVFQTVAQKTKKHESELSPMQLVRGFTFHVRSCTVVNEPPFHGWSRYGQEGRGRGGWEANFFHFPQAKETPDQAEGLCPSSISSLPSGFLASKLTSIFCS